MQTIRRLVPNFIVEKYKANELRGAFQGAAIFVDLSGFSKMTDALSVHGQSGAEALADLMRVVFEPLVNAVYQRDGFVIGYAGDAFNAVFSDDQAAGQETKRCLSALVAMQEHIHTHPQIQTPFGVFNISIKAGMGYGETRWQMFKSKTGAHITYWLRGASLDRAVFAEEHARPGDILADPISFERISEVVEAKSIDGYFCVTKIIAPLPAPTLVVEPEPSAEPMSTFFPEVMSHQAVAGEFRHIINLFVDIPINISDETLMAPFMETVYALQEQYGGFFLRPDLGDKGFNLLMFWGAPIARERDVERALNFVIDLAARTKLTLRAGVAYRIAYAGFIGAPLREDYTAYGWGVNLAARLMVHARAGEFWVDEEIARRAEQSFDVKYLGEYSLKGFAQKQRTYQLLGRKSEIQTIYHGELVGRKGEMDALAAFMDPMRAGRFAGVILVRGEAGIGKSRLVHEFQASGYFKDFSSQWILCQTEELVRQSFNPFKAWLRKRFDVVEGESDAANWENFSRVMETLVASTPEPGLASELTRTASVLAALVNITQPETLYEMLDAKGRYENTFIALSVLFRAESLQKPLVLFLEDVHWLDDDTRAFLDYFVRALLADTSKQYPIAIVTTQRLEGDTPLSSEIPMHDIKLGRLSSASVHSLAKDILGKPITNELNDLLDVRADGNPFFAEQILRYLSEENLLTLGEDGKYAASEQARDSLPVDVRAVMIARLDRLTQQVRETVQTAAVLGREFVVDVLVEMLRPQREQLPAYVSAAEKANIWTPISEIDYIFRHALLRDAAYSMQLAARQRSLHALACAAMEEVYRGNLEPYYGELAYHAEKGGVKEKALQYLNLAGDLAMSAYQNRQAIDYFTRTLALLPTDDPRAKFERLIKRVECTYNLGDSASQLADLDRLEELARRLADNGLLARALVRRAYRSSTVGDYPDTILYASQAKDLAHTAGDNATLLSVYIVLPDALSHAGKPAEARQSARDGIELARKLGNRNKESSGLSALGLVTLELEGPAAAEEYQKQALAIARDVKDRFLEGKILNNIALSEVSLGDYHTAREYFQQALTIFQEQGNQAGKGLALANLGWLSSILGDYPRAKKYYEQALTIAREQGSRIAELYTYVNLSASAGGQGKGPDALMWAEKALEFSVRTQDRVAEGWAHFNMAYANLLLNKYEQAVDAFHKSIEIRVEADAPALIIESKAGLVNAYTELGNHALAGKEIEHIIQFMEKDPSFEGVEEPLRVYLSIFTYLEKTKDPRANLVLQNAKQLMDAQVSKLRYQEARQMFVENVPWRCALQKLMDENQGPSN
jgi:predicted ATPase/class 3 adenylate cyclase